MQVERDLIETTEDAVLGGRLRLRQPKRGHRVGHDAILLAAATGGDRDEYAVDLGAGVGGAGLALAVRVRALKVVLVEIDAVLSELAAGNARLNDMDDRVRVITGDAEDRTALNAAGLKANSVDRVLMNPPFNDARRQNASPDPRRRLAHMADAGLLSRWIETAAWLLKPQGKLTLIWRAEGLEDILAALATPFGSVAVLPVFPRPAAPAIRVLVRAVKSDTRPGARPRRDLPGLVLNDENNHPSASAEAILRGGEALSLADS